MAATEPTRDDPPAGLRASLSLDSPHRQLPRCEASPTSHHLPCPVDRASPPHRHPVQTDPHCGGNTQSRHGWWLSLLPLQGRDPIPPQQSLGSNRIANMGRTHQTAPPRQGPESSPIGPGLLYGSKLVSTWPGPEFLHLGTLTLGTEIHLWWGCPCIVRCLAASLALTHFLDATSPLPLHYHN